MKKVSNWYFYLTFRLRSVGRQRISACQKRKLETRWWSTKTNCHELLKSPKNKAWNLRRK